jgi:hypothetical protein
MIRFAVFTLPFRANQNDNKKADFGLRRQSEAFDGALGESRWPGESDPGDLWSRSRRPHSQSGVRLR